LKIGTSIRIKRIKGKVKLKKVIKGCDIWVNDLN